MLLEEEVCQHFHFMPFSGFAHSGGWAQTWFTRCVLGKSLCSHPKELSDFLITLYWLFILHIQKGKANEWLPWTTVFGGELQRGWCCPRAMTAAGISAWGTGMGSWWSPIHNIVTISVAIPSASRLHRCSYISTGVQDYRPWILAFILWIIPYK